MASEPHTTLRMDTALRGRIDQTAAEFGVSRTELIKIVMKDFMDNLGNEEAPRILRLRKQLAEATNEQADLFS